MHCSLLLSFFFSTTVGFINVYERRHPYILLYKTHPCYRCPERIRHLCDCDGRYGKTIHIESRLWLNKISKELVLCTPHQVNNNQLALDAHNTAIKDKSVFVMVIVLFFKTRCGVLWDDVWVAYAGFGSEVTGHEVRSWPQTLLYPGSEYCFYMRAW